MIACRECHGEGPPCDVCDDGAALCDQSGCIERAPVQIDFRDDGGPSDWVMCGKCVAEHRDQYRRDDAAADAEVQP